MDRLQNSKTLEEMIHVIVGQEKNTRSVMVDKQFQIFISGIPTAGKTHLADKIAKQMGALHIKIDDWRWEIRNEPKFKPWVNLFWDKDENEYWKTTNCKQQWENLRRQSEALWPAILERISRVIESGKSAIFEGVNILPHLAARDVKFPGIFLIGKSVEEIFKRNKKAPRWGKTKELQKKEAEAFFYCEGPRYKSEAKKYGYKVFSDIDEAGKELLKIIRER